MAAADEANSGGLFRAIIDDDLCGERERWMGSNSNTYIHISLALIHISYNTNTH
jgi:hypothetical protein